MIWQESLCAMFLCLTWAYFLSAAYRYNNNNKGEDEDRGLSISSTQKLPFEFLHEAFSLKSKGPLH